MTEKTIKFVLDLDHLPPLSDSQRAELAALVTHPQSEIDFSDIPRLAEDFWQNAQRHSKLA